MVLLLMEFTTVLDLYMTVKLPAGVNSTIGWGSIMSNSMGK